MKVGYGNTGSIPFGGWILRFYTVFLEFVEKKMENRGNLIAYGYFGYYPLVAWMLRIYLVFLKFTDQMKNRVEDGIWEHKVLATCGPNSQNSYRFSRIHWKKMEIRLKIGFGTLGSNLLEGRIRIYPAFLFKVFSFLRYFFFFFDMTTKVIFHLRDELSELVPFFQTSLNKWKIRVKIEYCKPWY